MCKTCLKMWFFTSVDIKWYKVKWSSHICKKSSFFSFYSFLVKLSEWHRGSVRVKLTKCDKVEWSEKCHYASDIRFEWLHVWFVILLSYYFILEESDFLWKIYEKVQIVWKISVCQYYCWNYRNTEKYLNFEKFQLIWKIVKHFTRPK